MSGGKIGEHVKLVERVVLTPTGEDLRAELASLTAMADSTAPANKNPGSVAEPGLLSVVAGTRNQRDHYIVRIAV